MRTEFLVSIAVLLILITFILFVINSVCLEAANKIKHDSEKIYNSYTKVLDTMDKREVKVEVQEEVVPLSDSKTVYVMPKLLHQINYKDSNVYQLFQSINDNFDLDTDDIISKFDTSETSEYEVLKEMNDLLNENDRLYKIATLPSISQVEIMVDLINSNPKFVVFQESLNPNFSIIKFKENLENRLALASKKLYVYTSEKKYLNKTSDNVDYIYDSRIIKGVQCLQADKLYDYAIERKEVC